MKNNSNPAFENELLAFSEGVDGVTAMARHVADHGAIPLGPIE
jgi:hypothetical protein